MGRQEDRMSLLASALQFWNVLQIVNDICIFYFVCCMIHFAKKYIERLHFQTYIIAERNSTHFKFSLRLSINYVDSYLNPTFHVHMAMNGPYSNVKNKSICVRQITELSGLLTNTSFQQIR